MTTELTETPGAAAQAARDPTRLEQPEAPQAVYVMPASRVAAAVAALAATNRRLVRAGVPHRFGWTVTQSVEQLPEPGPPRRTGRSRLCGSSSRVSRSPGGSSWPPSCTNRTAR